MNRKNTLIFAVLVNAGIFLILSVVASRRHQEGHLQAPSDQIFPLTALQEKVPGEVSALPTRQPASDPLSILQEARSPQGPADAQYLEITARRDDQLDRLAVAYGTSPEEIIRLNHLSSKTLHPGQMLKIPLTRTNVEAAVETLADRGEIPLLEGSKTRSEEQIFYIVKKGDSPWSIAQKHKIKLEDLLRINDLDEKKARRLREGDRLRVS